MANGANKKLVLHVRLRCGSLSFTPPVSLLANEFDIRSDLHGQVGLAAVKHFFVIYEAMNGCENLKIQKRIASLTLQEIRSIHAYMNIPKFEFIS